MLQAIYDQSIGLSVCLMDCAWISCVLLKNSTYFSSNGDAGAEPVRVRLMRFISIGEPSD
jgi:hypothetical protein